MSHHASRKNTSLPELLAPAGSQDALRAAIAAGADAVYLSGKRFGARKYAANFSDKEIEVAVQYAHSHGVRVYVTVNTLIHDRELDGVLDYLCELWAMGVDAVLVQDTGLAALAREYLPDLPLHASTQLTIHNSDGVRWAAEQGFSRVVLARELSLEEVNRIAQETDDTGVGLEVFAHGALCYGYSGQCLLSSVIGGRSGNRGMCAQPCRKPYLLVQGECDEYGRPVDLREVPHQQQYLLSPKDLCTYRHLPELVRSPVASLKIEGRMKSPEYVAMVVSTYRRALDAIANGSWEPSEEAWRDLLLAFNREFTGGYLFGDRYESLMGRAAPDSRGLPVGSVERYDRSTGTAVIRPSCPVTPVPGDGLFFSQPGEAGRNFGFALNTAPRLVHGGYAIPVPAPVLRDTRVFITSSPDFDARARRIVAKPPADLLRPVSADVDICIGTDGTIQLSGTVIRPDGRMISVTYQTPWQMEPANTRPLTAGQLEEQFRKTGGTPFAVRTCTVRYEGGLFAPVARINELRREFFRLAGDQLGASYRPAPDLVEKRQADLKAWKRSGGKPLTEHPGRDKRLRVAVCTDSVEGVRDALAEGADTILFEPHLQSAAHTCGGHTPAPSLHDQVAGALEACGSTPERLVWKLPRILHDGELEDCCAALNLLQHEGLSACMSENPGISHALSRSAPGITLYGGSGLNVFNHSAACRTKPAYQLMALSSELSRDEITALTASAEGCTGAPRFALTVQGNSEALVTKDCIARLALHCGRESKGGENQARFLGLRDETGRVFPLHAGSDCRTRIANSAELCLIDMLPSLREKGISEIIIDARYRPPAYTREMTWLYRGAADATETMSGAVLTERLRQLKDQVKQISLGGISAGHFLRGLKE